LCISSQAGTDSEVYVTISGDNGSTEERRLYNDPQTFTRGAVDKFQLINAREVGSNKKLSFRLDDSNGHSGWALGRTELTDKTTTITSYGNFNSWITSSSAGVVYESYTQKTLYPYVITLVTGDGDKAALDGGCAVTVKVGMRPLTHT
jgi:hypothetical protein